MSKCALYAVNQYDQTTTATQSFISFTDIIRRFGCNATINGGNVVIAGYGYYDVDVNVVWTAGGTSLTLQLYDDGVAVPGTLQTMTVTDDQTYSITIPAIIKRGCDCESTLTVGIIGEGSVSNASIRIVKL